MSFALFKMTARDARRLTLPHGYRQTAAWIPRIGDHFPDFQAPSTHGDISFHQWAEGHWVYLCSHPSAGSPISATELVTFARDSAAYAARGVKILGMCHDTSDRLQAWQRTIEQAFGTTIDFPMIDDSEEELAEAFGITPRRLGFDRAIRRSFIIDPALRIRMIVDNPIYLGRSSPETLRLIDALQLHDDELLGIPANWTPGKPALVPHFESIAEAVARFGEDRIADLGGGVYVVDTGHD